MAKPRVWLDTNIVVRLLVGDDPKQLARATALLEANACRVTAAVLMECEWVLRGFYKLDARTIALSLQEFLSIDDVSAEHPQQMQAIVEAYEAGLDFADAVHAYQRPEDEPLLSFDRQFVHRALKSGVRGVRAA